MLGLALLIAGEPPGRAMAAPPPPPPRPTIPPLPPRWASTLPLNANKTRLTAIETFRLFISTSARMCVGGDASRLRHFGCGGFLTMITSSMSSTIWSPRVRSIDFQLIVSLLI